MKQIGDGYKIRDDDFILALEKLQVPSTTHKVAATVEWRDINGNIRQGCSDQVALVRLERLLKANKINGKIRPVKERIVRIWWARQFRYNPI